MEYSEKLEIAEKLFTALSALPADADFDDIGDCISNVLPGWEDLPMSGMQRRGWIVTAGYGQGDRGPAMCVRAKRMSDGVSGAVYFYGG